MILKSAGAVLLFALTLYISLQYTVMERRRVLQAEGFLLLLRHIRTQISCFSVPLPEIYASFENRALSDAGFLSVLQAEGLSAALSACQAGLYLEEAEARSLQSFAEELGKSYRSEQIALCDCYIAEWERGYDDRKKEMPRRARLGRSLLLTGGLMAVIVLL